MLFKDLPIIQPIQNALNEEGYSHPTPIQLAAIPHILAQKDLLGCAQTGTGKTAAFAIPMLQLLAKPKTMASSGVRPIRALVLTPTRELAIQIQESFSAYGRHLRLKHTVIFGGVNQHAQVETLRRGVDILVATPGRLLDLCSQGHVRLSDVEIFVLDEADRMLDMGFVHDVKKVLTKLPAKKQTLFFSATMPPEIQTLANTILHKPEKVSVTPPSTTAESINQWLFYVEKQNKRSLLAHILKDNNIDRALVFTRTKHGADKVVKELDRIGVSAEAIHGNKSQNARQRALSNFKNSSTRILVATDIASRGIDVDDLSYVINYELPEIPETYVHRIGRTGRAGANGISFSFCEAEETADLKDIQKLIGKNIPVQEEHPWHTTFNQVLSRPAPGQNRQARPKAAGQHHSRPGNRRPQPTRFANNSEKKQRREF